MKIIFAGWLVLAAFGVQAAKTVYVTDELEILLRSGQGSQYRIVSSLESGTPLTVLKNDRGDGWTHVKTEDKKTGWVLTRFLTESPTARAQLETAARNLDSVRQENQQIKEELSALKGNNQNTATENDALLKEKNRLIQEVTAIRQASSEAVQIMEERDQLQERVINLERDLQNVKRENQTLSDSTAQDWFLIGAGVLLGGILLGLILPKLSWRRKSRSWDSF
ncbi:MAG: TIGR04211 family SH3 domain-containing protein [Methylococcaceae bacterium]|nr:TIGR04211 family SH3 domain-containing protein [Methylococcaceae bacterium]MCI0666598.1 TIGR04211 family SH3 domain-containing protein [Methylococcaceae bacterium]MCI0734496.1 TIGR04211 family SH3 domain-containing protein [Methylococcaceae bacterium]